MFWKNAVLRDKYIFYFSNSTLFNKVRFFIPFLQKKKKKKKTIRESI